MADQPRYRTLIETPEYTAQFDDIVGRHSIAVITPVLTGLLWGIAANPRAYDKTTWAIYQARSRSLGLTIPTFTIFFQIQNEGEENEQVLLLWIEEVSTTEEMMDS